MIEALFLAGAANQLARANASELLSQQASQKSSDVRRETEAIKFDVEKLFMITEALWSIVKAQNGYSDEDLAKMIQEIDLRGGRLDGKRERHEKPDCPTCGRKLSGRIPICMYCGQEVLLEPFAKY